MISRLCVSTSRLLKTTVVQNSKGKTQRPWPGNWDAEASLPLSKDHMEKDLAVGAQLISILCLNDLSPRDFFFSLQGHLVD